MRTPASSATGTTSSTNDVNVPHRCSSVNDLAERELGVVPGRAVEDRHARAAPPDRSAEVGAADAGGHPVEPEHLDPGRAHVADRLLVVGHAAITARPPEHGIEVVRGRDVLDRLEAQPVPLAGLAQRPQVVRAPGGPAEIRRVHDHAARPDLTAEAQGALVELD